MKFEATTDLYWKLSDPAKDDKVIESGIRAEQSNDPTYGMVMSIAVGVTSTNAMRTLNLTGTNKADGFIFFKKNF